MLNARQALMLLLTMLAVASCGGSRREAAADERDRQLQQKWDAWYQKQAKQDCVAGPYEEEAIAAVRRAHAGEAGQRVFGPKDPYNRRAKQLGILRTRSNPKGDGVLVTGWLDANRAGSADYSRERWVWLVLQRVVYPLHVAAAGALGRLFDGLPEDVQRRSGLVHTYARGKTILDQVGIEEKTFERRFSGGNPFPTCT